MFVIFSVRLSIDLITTTTATLATNKTESSTSAARDYEPTFATCSPFCLRLTHVRPGHHRVDENLPKSESSNRKSAIASARLVQCLINHRGRASPSERREKKVNLAKAGLRKAHSCFQSSRKRNSAQIEETEGRMRPSGDLSPVLVTHV